MCECELACDGCLKLSICMEKRALYGVRKCQIKSIVENTVVPKCHSVSGDDEFTPADSRNVETQYVGDGSISILYRQALRPDGRLNRIRYLKDQMLRREQSDEITVEGSENSPRLFDVVFVLQKPLDHNRCINDVR